MSRKAGFTVLVCLIVVSLLSACTNQTNQPNQTKEVVKTPQQTQSSTTSTPKPKEPTKSPTVEPTKTPIKTPLPSPKKVTGKGYLIVLDAGHQKKQNTELEPNGPGSDVMKKKVSSGTRGTVTGLHEYALNLTVAEQLKAVLEERGYRVIMTRESHNVNISNVERAMIGNDANADAVVRIHANGSNNKDKKGILTVCTTKKNPYIASLYKKNRCLSDCVLEAVIETTQGKNRGVWETDTMTGLNWSEVPTTIIEMGYMSNAEEDQLLASNDYQDKIVQGIANGLDAYFSKID